MSFMRVGNRLSAASLTLAISVPILCSPLAVLSAQQKPFEFTIANIMRGPELYGREPANIRWSADNQWIYFSWNPPG
ncbi:MAG: hypothetical protein ABI120_09670, partial [Gemmatimonadaceae bacterium]